MDPNLKTMKKIFLTMLTFSILVVFQSCEQEGNEKKVSGYESTASHNMGQNCLNCHKSGGSGEGWFSLAGTVYDSLKTATLPNSTVKLYSGPNGTGSLIGIIEVDGLGNFYTTNSIDFGNGIYPSVEGDADTKYMFSSIVSGACNSCHGVSTDRIWTK